MKPHRICISIIVSVCLSLGAFADEIINRAETKEIIENLTARTRLTWISAGTIQATHEEYRAPKTTDEEKIDNRISQEILEYQRNPYPQVNEKLRKMTLEAIPFNVRYEMSNEYTMSSNVIVKYDGDRFYWEIDVISRTDTVKPGFKLESNFMTREFNSDYNGRRAFIWNGQKYTIYSFSADHAMVDEANMLPRVVNGPLTAGIIPWGAGLYSRENLSENVVSAVKRETDRATEIELITKQADGTETLFVLDPDKDLAVVSCLIKGQNSVVAKQYNNYRLISGDWIPTKIVIETYDASGNNLLESDYWNFTGISGEVPQPEDFTINDSRDKVIEHYSGTTRKPLIYRYSEHVDTNLLLAQKLDAQESNNTQLQNCATVALHHAAMQLGKDISSEELSTLVNGSEETTSLFEMKKLAQRVGLECRVVKTSLESLRGLYECTAILHLPVKNHFVILDHIDEKYAWILDLSANKFFYRADVDAFSSDWSEGTALLISEKPIQLMADSTEIDETVLKSMLGGTGYACNVMIQQWGYLNCRTGCTDYYVYFFERWDCGVAASGTCDYDVLPFVMGSKCIVDPIRQSMCTVTGDWDVYFSWACD